MATAKVSARSAADWKAILHRAVTEPGVISAAYRRFWQYSTGNQSLAMWQCHERGLEPGPLNTFLGWRDLGRHVKKRQKALTLCMPVKVKLKKENNEEPSAQAEQASAEGGCPTVTRFIYRPNWFVLAQTQGKDYVPQDLPQWQEARALETLTISRIPFSHLDGNAQGFARDRSVSVSPLAFALHRTLFHEIAHVVLGHTAEGALTDDERTPRNLREVEAECVALICCESLELRGREYSRGYIQHWLGNQEIPERSVHHIFKAADSILRAGRPIQG